MECHKKLITAHLARKKESKDLKSTLGASCNENKNPPQIFSKNTLVVEETFQENEKTIAEAIS